MPSSNYIFFSWSHHSHGFLLFSSNLDWLLFSLLQLPSSECYFRLCDRLLFLPYPKIYILILWFTLFNCCPREGTLKNKYFCIITCFNTLLHFHTWLIGIELYVENNFTAIIKAETSILRGSWWQNRKTPGSSRPMNTTRELWNHSKYPRN